jgi:hypothetical protein
MNYVWTTWGGDVSVDAGAGDDSGAMSAIAASDEIIARLGDGNDMLSVDNSRGFKVSLLGDGGGFDSLQKTASVTSVTTFTQSGWEYVNGIQQLNPALTTSKGKTAGVKMAKAG